MLFLTFGDDGNDLFLFLLPSNLLSVFRRRRQLLPGRGNDRRFPSLRLLLGGGEQRSIIPESQASATRLTTNLNAKTIPQPFVGVLVGSQGPTAQRQSQERLPRVDAEAETPTLGFHRRDKDDGVHVDGRGGGGGGRR